MTYEVTIKLDEATASLLLDAITERTLFALAAARATLPGCSKPPSASSPVEPRPAPATGTGTKVAKRAASRRFLSLETLRTRLDAGKYARPASAIKATQNLKTEDRAEGERMVNEHFARLKRDSE